MLVFTVDTDDVSLEESQMVLASAFKIERKLHEPPFIDGNVSVSTIAINGQNFVQYVVEPFIRGPAKASLTFKFLPKSYEVEENRGYEGGRNQPSALTAWTGSDLTLDFQKQREIILEHLKKIPANPPNTPAVSTSNQGSIGY